MTTPRNIPLGLKLHIPGQDWQVAVGTGCLFKGGNRVDLLYDSYEEARHFDTRWMLVTIITRREWQQPTRRRCLQGAPHGDRRSRPPAGRGDMEEDG